MIGIPLRCTEDDLSIKPLDGNTLHCFNRSLTSERLLLRDNYKCAAYYYRYYFITSLICDMQRCQMWLEVSQPLRLAAQIAVKLGSYMISPS